MGVSPLAFAPVAGLLRRAKPAKASARTRPVNPQARRRWLQELERMGEAEVRDHLYSLTNATGPTGPFPQVDAGIMFGADRFPSRAFVETWLDGDDKSTHADWRLLVTIVLVTVGVMYGLLLLV